MSTRRYKLAFLFRQALFFSAYRKTVACLRHSLHIGLLGHVQNPPAIKINPRSKSTRSKSTQPNLRTAYQSRVRVRGNSDSKK